ncbi:helix-turn-helix transcriptional regulator [Kitasatospora sp. RB6PN24]|uniref:helix-turn-helix domain-containing protein n=1 Tax=Kitasatospora humi TaxID=2893891 RepID=UPI001E3CA3BF|nr:helix-turn-helix transcriptional regulator [Kitasatospora humi]MCC9306701.1 helix-turn-helix transcriptional regulator [Kitasatospora humi]
MRKTLEQIVEVAVMAVNLDVVDGGALDEKRMTWGDVLRMIREERGLTQAQLADLVKAHQTMISHLELGKTPPDEKWARLLDEKLDAGGRLVMAFKLVEPYLAQPQAKWDAFKDFKKLESQAVRLYEFSTGRITGLLQSEAYMRALYRLHNPWESDEEIGERVVERLGRQAILFRADRARLINVIDEAVLRRVVGGPAVMREQHAHMLTMMQLPNVNVQVLPFAAGAVTPAPMSGMTILELANGRKRVYSESLAHGHIIESARQVRQYVDDYDEVRAQALSHAASAELIRDVMEGLPGEQRLVDQEQLLGRQQRPVRRVRPAVRYPRRRSRA